MALVLHNQRSKRDFFIFFLVLSGKVETWTRSFIYSAEEAEAGFLEISSHLCISSPLFSDMSTFSLQPGIKKNTLFCMFLPFPLRIFLCVWKWWCRWMKAEDIHSAGAAFLFCSSASVWVNAETRAWRRAPTQQRRMISQKCFRDHNTSDLIATFWCQSLEIREQGFPPTPLFSADKQWQWEQYIIEEDVKFPSDSRLYRLEFSAARRQLMVWVFCQMEKKKKKTLDILLHFTSYFWKTDTWTSPPRLLKRTLGNVGKC